MKSKSKFKSLRKKNSLRKKKYLSKKNKKKRTRKYKKVALAALIRRAISPTPDRMRAASSPRASLPA